MAEGVRRIVVLISGNGSNLQALIDSCGSEKLPSSKIVHVIYNRKNAYGKERAEKAGIGTTYHNIVPYKKKHPDNEQQAKLEYDAELARLIINEKPDVCVCAGWMAILSGAFVETMLSAKVPVINLHPSLPDPHAIKGAGAIERAYEMFKKGEITKTGVMIHHVVEEVDSGRVLVWKEVEMYESDSVDDLATRIHSIEWVLIVEGTKKALDEVQS